MKVLIVDDDEVLGALIRAMLERESNYRVNTAKDGQEGYLTYLYFQPKIIITDIEMPIKNGLEMVRDIRVHDSDVRIIYMSGDIDRFWSLLENEKTKYQAGFLKKPFSRFELARLLSEISEKPFPNFRYEGGYTHSSP
ncbi:MAG: response regulator [Thermodesulfobacteriota bacterium]|nr:MAG: response regulator [Thermodesulfobacteriota bacterium]